MNRWTYKGHVCVITKDEYDDVIKTDHWVDDRRAPLYAYDDSRAIVEAWIDAGMPPSDRFPGHWTLDALKLYQEAIR